VGDASRIGLEPPLRARPSCHARDMADFTVETANGVVTSYSGVEARHDLNAQSGVLVVWDGKGKRLKFSPGPIAFSASAWSRAGPGRSNWAWPAACGGADLGSGMQRYSQWRLESAVASDLHRCVTVPAMSSSTAGADQMKLVVCLVID